MKSNKNNLSIQKKNNKPLCLFIVIITSVHIMACNGIKKISEDFQSPKNSKPHIQNVQDVLKQDISGIFHAIKKHIPTLMQNPEIQSIVLQEITPKLEDIFFSRIKGENLEKSVQDIIEEIKRLKLLEVDVTQLRTTMQKIQTDLTLLENKVNELQIPSQNEVNTLKQQMDTIKATLLSEQNGIWTLDAEKLEEVLKNGQFHENVQNALITIENWKDAIPAMQQNINKLLTENVDTPIRNTFIDDIKQLTDNLKQFETTINETKTSIQIVNNDVKELQSLQTKDKEELLNKITSLQEGATKITNIQNQITKLTSSLNLNTVDIKQLQTDFLEMNKAKIILDSTVEDLSAKQILNTENYETLKQRIDDLHSTTDTLLETSEEIQDIANADRTNLETTQENLPDVNSIQAIKTELDNVQEKLQEFRDDHFTKADMLQFVQDKVNELLEDTVKETKLKDETDKLKTLLADTIKKSDAETFLTDKLDILLAKHFTREQINNFKNKFKEFLDDPFSRTDVSNIVKSEVNTLLADKLDDKVTQDQLDNAKTDLQALLADTVKTDDLQTKIEEEVTKLLADTVKTDDLQTKIEEEVTKLLADTVKTDDLQTKIEEEVTKLLADTVKKSDLSTSVLAEVNKLFATNFTAEQLAHFTGKLQTFLDDPFTREDVNGIVQDEINKFKTNLELQFQDHQNRIVALETQKNTLKSELTTDLDALIQKLKDDYKLSEIAQKLSQLTTENNAQQNSIDDNINAIKNIQDSMLPSKETLNELQNTVNTLQTTINEKLASITQNTTNLASFTEKLDDMKTQLDTMQTNLNTHLQEKQEQEDRIIERVLEQLKQNINNTETNITTLKGDLDITTNNVSKMRELVDNVTLKAMENASDIETHEEQLDDHNIRITANKLYAENTQQQFNEKLIDFNSIPMYFHIPNQTSTWLSFFGDTQQNSYTEAIKTPHSIAITVMKYQNLWEMQKHHATSTQNSIQHPQETNDNNDFLHRNDHFIRQLLALLPQIDNIIHIDTSQNKIFQATYKNIFAIIYNVTGVSNIHNIPWNFTPTDIKIILKGINERFSIHNDPIEKWINVILFQNNRLLFTKAQKKPPSEWKRGCEAIKEKLDRLNRQLQQKMYGNVSILSLMEHGRYLFSRYNEIQSIFSEFSANSNNTFSFLTSTDCISSNDFLN